MATFNYAEMQDVAVELITEFGNPFELKKPDGESVYNPKTKRNEQRFTSYKGICVMKTYATEAIGELANIIHAGDVEFKAVMNVLSVVPKEEKDKLIYGGVSYNIISVATSNPSGQDVLVHTLHCRRAS